MDSSRRDAKTRRRTWCCSYSTPPPSPDNPISVIYRSKSHHHRKTLETLETLSKHTIVGRILSPGRVSPVPFDSAPQMPSNSFRGKDGFDVRLNLRGKKGGCMVLELSSAVLSNNSQVFAALIADYNKGLSLQDSTGSSASASEPKMCRMEVPQVENLGVFRETIELMFEDAHGITKRLIQIGVFRSIDILEVSAGIVFTRGVLSCLKYLEAVPWTEEEEEKLRSLFTRFKFDDATTRDILGRLYLHDDAVDSQPNVTWKLVWSISTCEDANARSHLKSLVKVLLCKSSVYEKNHIDLSKEDLYSVCHSCVASLASLLDEASDTAPYKRPDTKKGTSKPLIERISRQVDNINWLLEIMLDRQIAEDFVDVWADQHLLIEMRENASPMIRYELSRVSAILFVAMGTRKLQCRLEARSVFLQSWFGPMLSDFGWLQRCRKGLDVKALEEAMGQTLLTLPLKQQHVLFMEWFRHFSSHGTECPNLSKAFQIWWRRSFLRGSETHAIESR